MPNDRVLKSSPFSPVVRVVDDDESVRRSIRYSFLVSGISCQTYENAEDFLTHNDNRFPGCVILDLTMPDMNGLELQEEMIRRGIDLPILFLSGNGDVPSVVQALKSGASDFLEKPFDPEELRTRVKQLFDENIKARKENEVVSEMRERFDSLTKREKVVIRLVAEDYLNREIAEKLNIQEHTVKVHRGNATNKLNVHSALEIHKLLLKIGEI